MGFRRRLLVLYLAAAGALALVWLRVGQVQCLSGDRWQAEAASMRVHRVPLPGPRGRILDADGQPLAQDVSALRLVFVPGEWATRERFRCARCGAVAFRRTPRYYGRAGQAATPPRRCTCGADGSAFEAMPSQDLAPLEAALDLPPGTLASAAEARMRDLEDRIEAGVEEILSGLDAGALRREATKREVPLAAVLDERREAAEGQEFHAEDLRKAKRADLFARPIPVTSYRLPSTGEVRTLRSIDEAAERLIELDADGRYRGFRAEPVVLRDYPAREVLAQCVGFVGAYGSRQELEAFQRKYGQDEVLPDDRVGRLGLEAQYDASLRGSPGTVRLERDDDGLFTRRTVEVAPHRGQDVRLHMTLASCRRAREDLLAAATDADFAPGGVASAAFFVMDAETGDVLAWAESPAFDPNGDLEEVVRSLDEEEETAASADRAEAVSRFVLDGPARPHQWISRVASVAVEPGSSMKVVTVAALLESGHDLPEDYHCAGPVKRSPTDGPKCHYHQQPVGPESALEVSCNRYCADVSSAREHLALHQTLFPRWARAFGIGCPPGLDYPRCAAGAYPAHPGYGELRLVSIGQSMLATPVQLARAVALVANGRFLPIPRLAAQVGDQAVQGGGLPVDLSPTTLRRVRAGMRACVETGTAKGHFHLPGLEGVAVYGKTGTATATGLDWLAEGRREESGGPWHHWFVGYSVKPGARTLAFAMVLHSRKTGVGGESAAPAVARFLAWWYGR